jgi:hypothetical protein
VTRYAIEEYHLAARLGPGGDPWTQGSWRRLDDPYRRGPRAWAPREHADEAAWKCLMWTGRTGRPAMRVIDLETSQVVWCWGADELVVAGAGPWILPAWHQRTWRLAETGERPYPASQW